MARDDEHAELEREVLSGRRRDLQMLAARGVLPLPVQRLVSLQVALVAGSDRTVSTNAQEALREADPKILAQVVTDGADVAVLTYLALHLSHPLVHEAILRRRDVPRPLLREMAPTLSPEMQEILLLRQDAILEEPAILEALSRNPQLGSFARRRIGEYRQHLLPPERAETEREQILRQAEKISDEEMEAALEEAAAEPAFGEVDELTGLSESQLRSLPVPVRLRLARGAPRALRSILVRDPNPLVSTAVLQNNPMSDSEVEQVAKNRSVSGEVLEEVSRNRAWIRKYPIVLALVRNPRTPTGIALRLAGRLAVRDLRALARDRDVANAVRITAERLYKMKRG